MQRFWSPAELEGAHVVGWLIVFCHRRFCSISWKDTGAITVLKRGGWTSFWNWSSQQVTSPMALRSRFQLNNVFVNTVVRTTHKSACLLKIKYNWRQSVSWRWENVLKRPDKIIPHSTYQQSLIHIKSLDNILLCTYVKMLTNSRLKV